MSTSSITDFWSTTELSTYQLNFNWTIANFSFYLEDDPTQFTEIKSRQYWASDHEDVRFYLCLYPNNQKNKDNSYLSLFLCCKSVNFPSPVNVKYRMSIVDSEGNDQHWMSGQYKFIKYSGVGSPKLLARSVLLDPANELLPDDQLTIRCEATICLNLIYQSSLTSRIVSTDSEQYEKQFSLDMISLLENVKHSDVILSIDGMQLPAHKNILSARSPVFDAMFGHQNTKEAQESKVVIVDVSKDTFKDLLEFIYTGKVPEMERLTIELLAASDKYQVESLKSACESHLSTSLSIETAASVLLIADMHGADKLKTNAINFIAVNIFKIMPTDAWINMAQARPELMREISNMTSKKTGSKRARVN